MARLSGGQESQLSYVWATFCRSRTHRTESLCYRESVPFNTWSPFTWSITPACACRATDDLIDMLTWSLYNSTYKVSIEVSTFSVHYAHIQSTRRTIQVGVHAH